MKLIKASVDRLPEKLRFAFCGLSLFKDSFTPEAAVAVLDAKRLVDLKRKFTAGLRRRCLLDFNGPSGRFSMHPFLSQFGREICSEQNKKVFYPRLSFYFLGLMEQHMSKIAAAPNPNFGLLVLFVLFEYSHLCNAFELAEALDTSQVKALREFSIKAMFFLPLFFPSEAGTFIRRCSRVARAEKDKMWLHFAFAAEMAANQLTEKKLSPQDFTKRVFNFFEQESTAEHKENNLANFLCLLTLSMGLLSFDSEDGAGELMETIAREMHKVVSDLSPGSKISSNASMLARFFHYYAIPRSHHVEHRQSEFCDLHASLLSDLESLAFSDKDIDLRVAVRFVAEEVNSFFSALTLPAPLGRNLWDTYHHSSLLRVSQTSRSLCRKLGSQDLFPTTSFQLLDLRKRFGSIELARGGTVLQSLSRQNVLQFSSSSLSFYQRFKWFGMNQLWEFCKRKDGAAVKTFLDELVPASVAEKAFLCYQQASVYPSHADCKAMIIDFKGLAGIYYACILHAFLFQGSSQKSGTKAELSILFYFFFKKKNEEESPPKKKGKKRKKKKNRNGK